MAEEQGAPPERVAAVVRELRARGLIAGDGGTAVLTPAGRAATDRAVAARCELLHEVLADPDADRRPEVDALLRRLAAELAGERPA